MLKVDVAGYFVGAARDLEQAEDMVEQYMTWLDSTGKLDAQLSIGGSVSVPFAFTQDGRVMFEGDAKIEMRKPLHVFAN